MKRSTVVILLIALAVVGSIFWWNRNKDEAPPPVPEVISLKVGYIPIIDCSQLYVASKRGYFDEQQLNVELVPMAGGPMIIQALTSGAVDVGFANLATVVFYEGSSVPLKRLAGGTRMDQQHSEAGLVVLATSGIQGPIDLKGKSIAVNSRKNIVDMAVLRFIRKAGLAADDITLVEIPFKDMEAALRAGRVDAATLPEPILTAALKTEGLHSLGDYFVLAFGSITSTGYFAMPSGGKVSDDVARRFNLAMVKATGELNSHDSTAWSSVAAATKLPADLLNATGKPEYLEQVSPDAFLQMRTWMTEEGLLDPAK